MPHVPSGKPNRPPSAPSPAPPAPQAGAKPEGQRTLRVGLGSLSIEKYEPDHDKIVKALFPGKEPVRDDHTGAMVLKPIGGSDPAPKRP